MSAILGIVACILIAIDIYTIYAFEDDVFPFTGWIILAGCLAVWSVAALVEWLERD